MNQFEVYNNYLCYAGILVQHIFKFWNIEKCHKTEHQKQLNHSYLEFEN